MSASCVQQSRIPVGRVIAEEPDDPDDPDIPELAEPDAPAAEDPEVLPGELDVVEPMVPLVLPLPLALPEAMEPGAWSFTVFVLTSQH